jgi:hypothetical protein
LPTHFPQYRSTPYTCEYTALIAVALEVHLVSE